MNIEELLRWYFETDLEDAVAEEIYGVEAQPWATPIDPRTETCFDLRRYWELTFRPSSNTAEEKAHLSECSYCQNMQRICAEEAIHPGLLADVAEIERHVDEDKCERPSCALVARIRTKGWLRGRIGQLAQAIPSLATSPHTLGCAFGTSNPVGQFAPNVAPAWQKPFEISMHLDNHNIDVTLRDSDDQLCVYLDTEDRTNAGCIVRIQVLCSKETLSADLVLKGRERFGPHGFHSFGSIKEHFGEAGQEFCLLAEVRGPETLIERFNKLMKDLMLRRPQSLQPVFAADDQPAASSVRRSVPGIVLLDGADHPIDVQVTLRPRINDRHELTMGIRIDQENVVLGRCEIFLIADPDIVIKTTDIVRTGEETVVSFTLPPAVSIRWSEIENWIWQDLPFRFGVRPLDK
jgi:hypothetical protein